MNYGPVIAAAFVLWPVIAVLGGQGFAPLLGLTGFAALFLARPRLTPPLFAALGFTFIVWAAASEFWAPGNRQLISGSLAEGNFSVESRGLSFIVIALTSGLTIAGTLRAAPSPRASGIIIAAMLGVQAVLVVLSPYLSGFVLSAVYGEDVKGLHGRRAEYRPRRKHACARFAALAAHAGLRLESSRHRARGGADAGRSHHIQIARR
jgi:hypothetical protein